MQNHLATLSTRLSALIHLNIMHIYAYALHIGTLVTSVTLVFLNIWEFFDMFYAKFISLRKKRAYMIKIRKTFIVGIAALLGAVSLSACELPSDTPPSLSSETSQVEEKLLVDIAATNNKASYEVGESLDITVKAHYSDGSYEEVTDYEVSGFYNENPGVQSVTINYKGKVAVVNVYVNPRPVVLENIVVTDNKATSGYEIDDELDIDVVANYSDGTTVELTDYTITTFDNQNAGQQELVVTYQDKTAKVTVTVNPKPIVLENITVTDNKAIDGYEIGDELDITVIATYSDGHTEELQAGEYAVTGYDSMSSGQKDLVVTYNGKTFDLDVTVNPAKLVRIEVVDNKAEAGYEYDEELDLTVTAYYTDNSVVEIKDYEVEGYNNELAGNQEITVTFEEKTANVTIFMKANTFPVTPFETFVVAKDVWVEVPVPYGTGTWTNGTASDTQFGVGFHAETPDTAKTSIDLKYTKVLEEDGWNVVRTNTKYVAKKGNAVINYRTRRNVFSFNLFVTGEPRPVYAESFVLRGPEQLAQGKTTTLTIKYTPSNANQKPYLWTSSDETIATVDENGLVTALELGTVTITAVAKNANQEDISATFNLEVIEQVGDAWTIMLYLCGSNLESDYGAASEDIEEVLAVNSQPEDINFLFQTGGTTYWHNSQISANKLCRFHADNHNLVLDEKIAQNNMGSASTLASYINWGMENYPADKYGVILWNHGGALDGVCFDDNYYGDGLTASEVVTAMNDVFEKNRNSKLEFIGYDACLMGCQDIAEFNAPYFNYMVSSEETEEGDGWDYEGWVDDLYAHKSTEDVLKACCTSFVDQYGSYQNDQTLSVLDLSMMENYFNKFEAFAAAIKTTAKNNLSSFKNLLTSAKCFYGVSSYGLIDAYDAVTKIKANSTYAQYSAQIQEAMDAFNDLVIHNSKGNSAGKAYGLALHACVGSYNDYPQSETHFNTWRSIFF